MVHVEIIVLQQNVEIGFSSPGDAAPHVRVHYKSIGASRARGEEVPRTAMRLSAAQERFRTIINFTTCIYQGLVSAR